MVNLAIHIVSFIVVAYAAIISLYAAAQFIGMILEPFRGCLAWMVPADKEYEKHAAEARRIREKQIAYRNLDFYDKMLLAGWSEEKIAAEKRLSARHIKTQA